MTVVEDPQEHVILDYFAFDGRDFEQYKAQIAENYRPYSNGYAYYRELVDPLASDRKLSLLPLYEVAKRPPSDKPIIALRHDIDADPDSGLRLARYLARVGICGSFYLLHSALYYGELYRGVFIRNPALADWIRGFVVAGSEIGLHNDTLGMFFAHGLDPIAMLRSELTWLRSQGAVIRGTVAHNSIVVQLAENYEIFADRVLWPRTMIDRTGRKFDLGSVSMAEFGIDYEGTFALPRQNIDPISARAFAAALDSADIRSRNWMRTYLCKNPCCQWDIDYQIWLLGKEQWAIAGGERNGDVFIWNARLDDVLAFVKALPPGSRTVIVLHPEYFGDYGSN